VLTTPRDGTIKIVTVAPPTVPLFTALPSTATIRGKGTPLRIMPETSNLNTGMDIDEVAIDEGLYSRQL
jgi:hypothetical protein